MVPARFVVRVVACFVVASAGFTPWARAQAPCGPFKLTASTPTSDDILGSAAALDGDTLVVGAPAAFLGSGAGRAFVFRWSGTGWMEEAELAPSDGALDDRFGRSVAIHGNTIVIGANLNDDSAGANQGTAYVFRRSGSIWTEIAKLVASDAAAGDLFGTSVAVHTDTIAVGANLDHHSVGENQGSVYVFRWNGNAWLEEDRLQAFDAADDDWFGLSVSIHGDTIAVGSLRSDDVAGLDQGAAYVFVRSGALWIEEAKLLASDAAPNDQLGRAIDICGDTVVVGDDLDEGAGGLLQGSAYVFVRTGTSWSQQAKLTAGDGDTLDHFGIAVSIDRDNVVVGASIDEVPGGGNREGSAYLFRRLGTRWCEESKLVTETSGDNDRFGSSVSISGNSFLVGAAGVTGPAGGLQGAAYVFERLPGEHLHLLTSDGLENDFVGSSVALLGDTLVVGALGADLTALGSNEGAAYVFERDGLSWNETDKLIASDPLPGTANARDVALGGDRIILGSADAPDPMGNFGFGAAYVYRREANSWVFENKLAGEGPENPDRFGFAVDTDGETVVIGAPSDNVAPFFDTGTVTVYARSDTSWLFQGTLSISNAVGGEAHGTSVAVQGDILVAGAKSAGAQVEGAVHVWQRVGSTWFDAHELVASDGALNGGFGSGVGISGNTIVVSAQSADGNAGANQGAAYVFVFDGLNWIQQAKLTPRAAAANDRMGRDVAIQGDRIVLVGKKVHVFERSGGTWSETLTVALPGAITSGLFIAPYLDSVDLDGDTVVVGRAREDGNGRWVGAAYLFKIGENCQTPVVHNLTAQTQHATLSGAVVNALSGDTLESNSPAFSTSGPLDFLGLDLDMTSFGTARQSHLSDWSQAGLLTIDTFQAAPFEFYGSLSIPSAGRICLGLGPIFFGPASTIDATTGGSFCVAGDLRNAIDDSLRFSMGMGEIVVTSPAPPLTAATTSNRTFEIMSADIGPYLNGLDGLVAGYFPIESLRFESGVTTLVDEFDNDLRGQKRCEAIYVSNLVIDVDATVNTGTCKVYYETLTLSGSVDVPGNLQELRPFCPGDTDYSGTVGFADITAVLGNWLNDYRPGIGPGDANGDGVVNFGDITSVLGNWLDVCP